MRDNTSITVHYWFKAYNENNIKKIENTFLLFRISLTSEWKMKEIKCGHVGLGTFDEFLCHDISSLGNCWQFLLFMPLINEQN